MAEGYLTIREMEYFLDHLEEVLDRVEEYRVLNTKLAIASILLHEGATDKELKEVLLYLEQQTVSPDIEGTIDHIRVGLVAVRNNLNKD